MKNINEILLEITGDPEIKKQEQHDLSYCNYFKITPTSQIYIRDITLDKAKIALLCDGLKYSDLTHLEIIRAKISDIEASLLAEILPHTQIYNLNLSHNNIGQKGLYDVAAALSNSQVTNLNISGEQLFDNLVHVIPLIVSKDNKITNLNIGDHPMWKDNVVHLLADRLKDSNIEALNLSKTEISGLEELVLKICNSKVYALNISYNKYIVDDEIIRVAAIIKYTNIRELDISGTAGISDRGMRELADILENNYLITNIGMDGAPAFGPYLTEKTYTKIKSLLNRNEQLVTKLALFLSPIQSIYPESISEEDLRHLLKFYTNANKSLLTKKLNQKLVGQEENVEDIYQKVDLYIKENFPSLSYIHVKYEELDSIRGKCANFDNLCNT